jgi:hypothetical protein
MTKKVIVACCLVTDNLFLGLDNLKNTPPDFLESDFHLIGVGDSPQITKMGTHLTENVFKKNPLSTHFETTPLKRVRFLDTYLHQGGKNDVSIFLTTHFDAAKKIIDECRSKFNATGYVSPVLVQGGFAIMSTDHLPIRFSEDFPKLVEQPAAVPA